MPYAKSIAFACILLCHPAGHLKAQEALPRVLPRTTTPPEINGKIEVSEWKDAVYLGKFKPTKDDVALPETEAWMAMDGIHVYFAIRCIEPSPNTIVAKTLIEELKAPVWRDDSVEIFLDLGNTGKSIFQLVANSNGTVFDALILHSEHISSGWNSEALVRTSIGEASWEMELAIPIQTMGHQPVRGEVISLNIGRNRFAGGEPQTASLAPGPWATSEHPIHLLVEGVIKAGGVSIISPRRGPFFPKYPGVWEFQIVDGHTKTESFQISFPKMSPAPQTENWPKDTKETSIILPIATGEATEKSLGELSYQGHEIYRSEYLPRNLQTQGRIRPTRNPVFKELLEDRPEGLSRDGMIMWGTELDEQTKLLSARTAMEFSTEIAYNEYEKDRSMLIFLSTGLHSSRLELSKKHHVPIVAYLDARKALSLGTSTGEEIKRPWALDSYAVEAYLNEARNTIQAAGKHPNIRYLFAGDEDWEGKLHKNLLRLLDKKERHPQVVAADREIREKYGFGKYGLPESSTDTNPFRWIATFRWEIDKMLEIQHKVKRMIRKDAPDVKLISWDSIGGHRPYGISRWGKVFDVITFQLYPSRNPAREDFGFVTKFYSDLSGSDEIWPVPHVEHYAANFSTDEVEELLSQTFRNGATGLHLYPGDTLHKRGGKGHHSTDRIGAPERWNVVRSLIERLNTPFRVKQPTADTAIFYSNTSYQGTGPGEGHSFSYKTRNEVEWAYTVLGPRLQSALKFVDDLSVTKRPDLLSQYKTIYIPYMPIADNPEYEALLAYVEQGGTLVVCDPLAFRHRSDGSEREVEAILPPVISADTGTPQPVTTGFTGKPQSLDPVGISYCLKSEGKTLATYPDGAPAVIERSLGEGKVIYFGTNPMVSKVIHDEGWIAFFAALQEEAGASKGNPVWRFRFPSTPPLKRERPSGTCLTANYFEWTLSKPKLVSNATVGGSYRLSVSEKSGKEQADADIPFAKGKLTDRHRGAFSSNTADATNFVASWAGDQPVEIVYDFHRTVKADTARLFYSGNLPSGWCDTSEDGENWKKKAEWEASRTNKPEDVALKTLAFSPEDGRYVRLNFDATDGEEFILVETEIWGEE